MADAIVINKSSAEVIINDCWNRIGVWGNQKPRCPELDKVVHCANCKVYSNSGRMLLDREADPEYIAKWTGQLSEVKRKKDETSVSVVVFRIANEWLALPARLFQEVVNMRVFHRVPHAKSAVLKGIVNIRGELQLCVSLGRLLGIERGGGRGDAVARVGHQGVYERLVVIADHDTRYVFPVSEVRGIHRYGMSEVHNVPATVEHTTANYMKGMIELDAKHVGCLDEGLLFTALKRTLT
jgi:chemotaxis-related protein WspD